MGENERTGPLAGSSARGSGASASSLRSAAILAVALLSGCGDLLVDSPPETTAALQLSFAGLPAGDAGAASPTQAFDQADAVRIRLLRGGTAVIDRTLDFASEGQDARVRLEVPLEGDQETLQLELTLRFQGQDLFGAATSVTLSRGATTEAALTLVPIAAGIQVPGPVTLEALGEAVQLEGTVVFATGDAIPGLEVTWSTPNPDIVQVDPNGRVVALAEGDADAVGGFGSFSGTVRVQVRQTVVSVDVFPESAILQVEQTLQLEEEARDSRDNLVVGRAVQWTSSNPAVAAVSGTGLVTAVSPGSATITATVEGVEGTAEVLVTQDEPDPGDPPFVAEVRNEVVEINGCTNQDPPGTLHRISFQYSDPDGDVTDDGATIHTRATFHPDGATFTFSIPLDGPGVEHEGNGFAGDISFLVCTRFGNSTHTESFITLEDAEGNESNELTFIFQRPEGANVHAQPGATAPSGAR